MSVPVHKRTQSKLEFFNNFYKMYDTIVFYLLKDFGVKGVCKDLKAFTYGAKMTRDDAETFGQLCQTYDIGVELSYPLWMLEYYRTEVLTTLHYILNSIVFANTIYPNTEFEFNERKKHQWDAIHGCEYLLQLFQRIITILPVNAEKYTVIVEMICREIDLLRGWKKSTNKTYKAIAERNAKAALAVCPISFGKVNG